jgi:hypothetical protein
MRATCGDGCTGRTRAAAAESGWGRLELGDDMGAPAVGEARAAQAGKRLWWAGGGYLAGWAATLAGPRRGWSSWRPGNGSGLRR